MRLFNKTSVELRDHPEYAALSVLDCALEAARRTLRAAYWRLEEDTDDVGDLALPEEAFAMSLLSQITALEETVEHYCMRIERYKRDVERARRAIAPQPPF